MFWVLKRIVSMRQFFWASKTYVLSEGKENIHNFTLKNLQDNGQFEQQKSYLISWGSGPVPLLDHPEGSIP